MNTIHIANNSHGYFVAKCYKTVCFYRYFLVEITTNRKIIRHMQAKTQKEFTFLRSHGIMASSKKTRCLTCCIFEMTMATAPILR